MGVTISVQSNVIPLDVAIARMEQVEAIIEKFAGLIEAEAKTLVPVRTGRLRDEIHTVLNGLVADIISDTPYSVYVEYGSQGRPSHPFMRPAIEAYADEFVRAIAEAMGG